MKLALLALCAVLGAASFVPLIRKEAWWIRVFDFPRIQILVLSGAGLIALLAAFELHGPWEHAAALLALAGLALQVWRIYPYTPMAPCQVLWAAPAAPAGRTDGEASISLLVANVLMTNRQVDRLLNLIDRYRPDAVLLLEPDVWWDRQLRVLEARYPYVLSKPLQNCYGMLLYSRLPMIEPRIEFLIRDDIPSMHVQLRLRNGETVLLHALHPQPPSPTEAPDSIERDAELLMVGKKVRPQDRPTIVAGDLNDVAWSQTTTLFQRISGLLDPRRGRGMFNSFHAGIPFMRWPLDHVFHSRHFLLEDLQRLPAFGSDHFPVYVRLRLQPQAASVQPKPPVDDEDREQAEEKIEKAELSTVWRDA